MDTFTPDQRSRNMSRIRSKNTKPEMVVRSWLHKNGYRFRLHRIDLPGKPDIVLPRHKTAIFVNGCFWHQHQGCRKATLPKSNQAYWIPKLQRNVDKFESTLRQLEELGWKVIVIWECETKKIDKFSSRLGKELERGSI